MLAARENDALLNVRLSPADGLVCLKLFIPRYYGAFLVFGPDGEPLGVIDKGAGAVLAAAHATPVGELIRNAKGAIDKRRLESVVALVEQGLLQTASRDARVHWIAPDQPSGTHHTGRGADLFIDYFYSYFGSVFHGGSPLIDSHGEFLHVLERYFPGGAGALCIDAGCGSGYYAAQLARRGHHVIACDVSTTRLRAATQHDVAPGSITPVECTLERLPLADCIADFVMCNFVLEHVADPFAVIEELVRVTKIGGRILIAVPSLNLRDTLARWVHNELPTLNFEHLRSYGLIPATHPWVEPTVDTVQHLRRLGVDVERVQGTDVLTGLWEPWRSACNARAEQLGEAFEFTWPWNHLGQQTVFYGTRVA